MRSRGLCVPGAGPPPLFRRGSQPRDAGIPMRARARRCASPRHGSYRLCSRRGACWASALESLVPPCPSRHVLPAGSPSTVQSPGPSLRERRRAGIRFVKRTHGSRTVRRKTARFAKRAEKTVRFAGAGQRGALSFPLCSSSHGRIASSAGERGYRALLPKAPRRLDGSPPITRVCASRRGPPWPLRPSRGSR